MKKQNILTQHARMLPVEERERILTSLKETELHDPLRQLLQRIEPDSPIQITHGAQEHGSDLLIIRKDTYFGDSTVGIIVKSGNISGRTSGKVDEIKSQVDQALTSVTRLRTISGRQFVSEVWIVIAGKMSRRAQERLEKEVKERNIRIFDIKWLVEKFTDFYPEIFFEEKVIGFLQRKISELEGKHLFSKRGKSLSEYFVNPLIARLDISARFDEEKSLVVMEAPIFPFTQLNSIIRPRTKMLLVGDPGVGKSAALAKFVIDRLTESWLSAVRRRKLPNQIRIPILVLAKDLLKITSSHKLVKEYTEEARDTNRFKPSVIMIDGLDEVLPDLRSDVLLKAEDFCKELDCALLISTRKIDLIKTPRPGFKRYELLPFGLAQAIKFFEKITTDEKVLSTLKNGLAKIEYQIPMCALSLLLLVEIVESYKEIPASITELFDRFSDIALGRYDREKDIEVLFEYLIKKRFLSELAFKQFLEKERMAIPKKEFSQFLRKYAILYGWDRQKLEGFVKEIERAGILDLKELVSFPHRSFLEYFAAFYIHDNQRQFKRLEDYLGKIYFDDFWSDVSFFCAGLDRRVSPALLTKIFQFPKKESLLDKFLSGKLLQAGWQSQATLKRQWIRRITRIAPTVRKEFSKPLKDGQVAPVPGILLDYSVMRLSEISLGSGTLAKEITTVFNGLSKSHKPCYRNAYMMLSLLWSLQRFITVQEIGDLIEKIMDTLSKIPALPAKDEATAFLFLTLIEKKDKVIGRILRKKIKRLARKYPQVFRKLLPDKRSTFRSKLTKRAVR